MANDNMKRTQSATHLVRVYGRNVSNPNNIRNFNCAGMLEAAAVAKDHIGRDDVHKVQLYVLASEWSRDNG